MANLSSHVDMEMLDNVTETNEALGRGSFGEVKVIEHRGKKYAGKYFFLDLVDQEKILVECKRSYSIKHPNVVESMGFCCIYSGGRNNIILVMENMPFCLAQFVEFQERSIPEYISRKILHDVSKGLSYLHSLNIMHRDLTANNVLLTDFLTAKISDFGQAKCLDKSKKDIQIRQPGSLIYMPPEALGFVRGKVVDKIEYNFSIDIFSFGVLMIHLYLHDLPQPECQFMSLVDLLRLRRPYEYFGKDISRSISDSHPLHETLRQCLRWDPVERPLAIELEERMLALCDECKDSVFAKLFTKAIDYPRVIGEMESLERELEHVNKERELEGDETIQLKEKLRTLFEMTNTYKRSNRDSKGNVSSNASLLTSLSDIDTLSMAARRRRNDSSGDENRCSIANSSMASVNDPESMSKINEIQIESLYKEQHKLWEENKRLTRDNEALQREIMTLRNRNPNRDDDLMQSITSTFSGSLISLNTFTDDAPPTVCCSDEEVRDFVDNEKKLRITRTNKLSYPFANIEGAKAVFYKGSIYVGRATATVLRYTPSTQKWAELSPAPVKNYALTEFMDELILVGGSELETGTLSGDIYYFNEQEEQWMKKEDIPPLEIPRENAVAINYTRPGNYEGRNKFCYLVVLGGERRGRFQTEVLRNIEVYRKGYDMGEWYRGIKIPRNGFNLQFVTNSEYIYLLNPDGWTIRYCSLLQLIDKAISRESMDKVWFSIIKQVPFSRCSLAVYGQTLLALAGHGSDGHVYAYYPKKNKPQWKKVSCINSLPAVRNACCIEFLENKLFFFGGDIDMMNQAEQAGYIISVDDGTETTSDDLPGNSSLSGSYTRSYNTTSMSTTRGSSSSAQSD